MKHGYASGYASIAQPPRLLDQVRNRIRTLHYSLRTEESYVHWIKHFIVFNGRRHPREMGRAELEAFLTFLAVERHVAARAVVKPIVRGIPLACP